MCLMKLENMSEFNFKSQTATSIEQSNRLLLLGLKKETADMCHFWHWESDDHSRLCASWEFAHRSNKDIPAWSLHRLIEMLKNSRITISFIEKDTAIIVERYGVFQNRCEIWDNNYDNICDAIEWLIKEGYFNKEYLV